MPLVGGGTLQQALAQGVPFDRAMFVLSRILSALQYAHTREPAIVHRDIKPSNILMGQDGWPLLPDFGLVKILEPALHVTSSGIMVGAPEYLSPEQILGN